MQTMDQQQFNETVQQLNTRWDAAFNAKQPEQVAAFYDEAASLIPAGAAQVSGLKAIGEFWNTMIAQGIVEHRIEMIEPHWMQISRSSAVNGAQPLSIPMVTGRHLAVACSWSIAGRPMAAGKSSATCGICKQRCYQG